MKSFTLCAALLLSSFGMMLVSAAANFNYGDALDKSLLFFEAQRSGDLPNYGQRIKWRGDSGLKDGFLEGVDLVGGYYDAGDHVKFGLPMAFTVTMLSWAAIDFRKEITSSNQLQNTLDAIKWGTDYFIKAHPKPNVLWAQVGDGDSDHYCWERAEDMTTPRTAYKLDTNHPGSDLAGETAAALAAASLAFKPYNSIYSKVLLSHAIQLFEFADEFRGRYDNSIPSARNFYASASGYSDELLWAAAWLHRATNQDNYLKYVVDNAVNLGGTGWAMGEFSWDNKYAGVQILMSKVLLEGRGGAYTSTLKQYQAKADYFICSCLQKNDGYNILRTPGGLLYVREWNNLQYVSSAAFLLAVYSEYLSTANNAVITCPDAQVGAQDLLKFSQSQADYILGKNPKSISYLVGYGPSYPVQVHHRGSSIASITTLRSPVGCVQGFEMWYHRDVPNPNVLYGALVGGPDKNDGFSDERYNYEATEPTISGTAPLVGLFSKLQSASGGGGGGYSAPSYKKPSSSPVPHYTGSTPSYKKPSPSPVPYYTGSTPSKKLVASPLPHYTPASSVPVEFLHSITATWTIGQTKYYRHKVSIKNKSQKTITGLKLAVENLSGSLWGLIPTGQKNTYELPQWLNVLKPGTQCSFVYVQGGPQAKVTVVSYH